MPLLNLDNIEPDLHGQLCRLAKEEGSSVEQLVQSILRNAIASHEDAATQSTHLATKLLNRFSAIGLKDGESIGELKGQSARPTNFD